MLREVICVVILPLLVVIHNDNQSIQWPQGFLVLVKALGKARLKTRRAGVFNLLTSPIELPEVLLVMGALVMMLLHLG